MCVSSDYLKFFFCPRPYFYFLDDLNILADLTFLGDLNFFVKKNLLYLGSLELLGLQKMLEKGKQLLMTWERREEISASSGSKR